MGGPVKSRRRRTKEQIETLEAQIYGVLVKDRPQSIRHLFYRMTDPRLPEPVEKTEQGYNQVQQRITKMRRAGIIPYGWITDATRRGHHVNTFDDAADFIGQVAGLYRSKLWEMSHYYVEVWCESRSIAGVIEDDCNELAVSLYPCGGFTSITLAYQAAEYINARHDGKSVRIIYIGDYDPAGVLIDQKLESELREHLDDDVAMRFQRIAITLDQIADYDLPTKPRKPGERRVAGLLETVEAEAMPADEIRKLLRLNVEGFLPDDALKVARVAEHAERQTLLEMAGLT